MPLEKSGNSGSSRAPIETARDLGRALKHWVSHGPDGAIKVAALAKRLGISQSTLYAYLAGTTLPSVEALDNMLVVLKVPPAEQRRLTTARDALRHPRGSRGEPDTPPGVPAELPADHGGFLGRDAELAILDQALAAGPPVAVVTGPAGVGKTALAIHWGHRADFPDGCLYVDLHGYSQVEPRTHADALAGLLRGLGVADIPADVHEQAARFRSATAGRRILLVLDNARDVAQVRPLLPGGSPCFTVVTSRVDLSGLLVRPGAARVDLRPFAPSTGAELLRRQMGISYGEGGDADHRARTVMRLAERCGGLPLALRLTAARVRGGADLDELAERSRSGLDRFDVGDPETAVRTVFSWSLDRLPPDVVDDFRLMGAHPAHDLALPAAAALIGCAEADAARRLDVLVRAHLVQFSQGRYGMHDLIREFAREQRSEGADQAVARLIEYYATTTASVMRVLHPMTGGADAMPVEAARDWVAAEWDTLLVLITFTARHRRWADTTRLGLATQPHLDQGGRHTDALVILSHVHSAASAAGDRASEATALFHRGVAHMRLGRHTEAIDDQRRALALCQETGDRHGEAGALNNLGNLHERLGDYAEAIEHYRRSLGLASRLGLRKGHAVLLINIGVVHTRLGELDKAMASYESALSTFTEIGDHGGAARALGNLAEVHHLTGRDHEAIALFDRALELTREIGARGIETEILNNLAASHLSLGERDLAAAAHRSALAIAREVGDRYEQARACEGIGTVTADLDALLEATEIYTELGLADADRVSALLAEIA